MHGRLAALPATEGCLDLEQIVAIEKSGAINLEKKTSAAQLAELRDFLRTSLATADARLGRLFWDGGDVVQLVHSRGLGG